MVGYSVEEAQRLDSQHAFLRHAFDDKLLSPSVTAAASRGEIRRILDVGTGTGIWCFDAAAEIQAVSGGGAGKLEFVAVDVAKNEHWERHAAYPAPPAEPVARVTFEIADLNDDAAMEALLANHGGAFDLVHSRLLVSAIKEGKWQAYIDRIVRLLRPGGYVQMVEIDMMNSQSCREYDQSAVEALIVPHTVYRGLGLDVDSATQLAFRMRKAGFTRVRDHAIFVDPTTRTSAGSTHTDEILQVWYPQAFKVLRPIFFKLRNVPHYASLLDRLPEHARRSAPDGKPELLLADEAAYDDFEKRAEAATLQDPLYHSVFRMVTGQRPY